jgi:hypothetical protein
MLQAIKPRGLLLWMLLACPTMAGAAELDSTGAFVVQLQTVQDLTPVMATVERVDMAVARARLSGTIVDLYVDEGTVVKEGDVGGYTTRKRMLLIGSKIDNMLNTQVLLCKASTFTNMVLCLYVQKFLQQVDLGLLSGRLETLGNGLLVVK